ncbi:MAG TPA: omptin family outer membrane protease [Desulfopila sp.]|nr:omptin family outer membrane protease [Desulfopila sp.]
MSKSLVKMMGAAVGTLVMLTCALAAEPISAGDSAKGTTSIQIGTLQVEVTGRLGLGRIDGESKELVYNTDGTILSELIWTLDNVYMINGGISVQPLSWLKFNADLWVAVNDGGGTMDDYDWLVSGMDWTHWSHHEDVSLDRGIMFDINAQIPFYRLSGTVLSAFVGLKRDNWKWEAKGGTYIYSYYGFRDLSGSFPDGELAITYEQWWTVPYLGLGFESQLSNWILSGRLLASPFVQGEAEDMHHMRNLLFKDDFGTSSMWSVDFTTTYKFSPNWGISGAVKYQHYEEAKGSTTVINTLTGEQSYYGGDAAGADNEAVLAQLSLDYSF